MKTVMTKMYIHAPLLRPTIVNTKKSGKPSRPARGPKIGVAVAMALDEKRYGVNISLVNPGRTIRGGKIVGGDKFDVDIATKIAIAKIVSGDTLPFVAVETPFTKRGAHIRQQVDYFRQAAAKVFKDKSEVVVVPQKEMVKTGQPGLIATIANWVGRRLS